ncbi:hypothetical protein PAXRUDRAFT_128696 [Paxillus rubicundulus Ve08.2h10]|uniref:Unplaced genomic scaffold scaffold_2, whole genome shotgun sequence n=1 Tax=Paxillus rubicundulus Ve08.2h10 TaxID=930991 RepID=A0A0D0DYN2_9AGAM|nr:hypothetical protein PAXRUDRAFT_128696 [Paxillus rubicundulus Ve08.2h10]
MAQVASINPQEQAPRISQVLPAVKCSSCCQPVPLLDLGDHVCPPQPPPPSLLSLQRPPMSQKSATSLLPQRFHNLVSRSGSPLSKTPPLDTPPSEAERVPARSPSQLDPFQRLPPNAFDIGAPKATNIALPTGPGPSQTAPPASILINRGNPQVSTVRLPTLSAPERVSTPVRKATPPASERVRTPSNAGRPGPMLPIQAAPLPNPFSDTSSHSVVGRPSAPSLVRGDKPSPPSQQQPPWFGHRNPSNTAPPPSIQPRPSFERTRTPSANSASRPSLDKPRPSLDASHPIGSLRPSVDSQRPSMDRSSTSSSVVASAPVARPPRGTSSAPPPSQGPVPFPSTPAPVLPPPASTRQQPSGPVALPYSPIRDIERGIDTKIGGEAGMAGVGRRGFAAVSRAAMLVASFPTHHPIPPTISGDGRRANAPQYLDISATMGHVMRGRSFAQSRSLDVVANLICFLLVWHCVNLHCFSHFFLSTSVSLTTFHVAATTPPLSPNSGHTSSPVSPFPTSPVSLRSTTPTNGQYLNLPSPHEAAYKQSQLPLNEKGHTLSSSHSGISIASPSDTPSLIPNPFERHLSSETVPCSPTSEVNVRLPFLDILKPEAQNDVGNESDDESVYTTHTSEPSDAKKSGATPMSPSADSEVGLAYADDSDGDTPVVMPLDFRKDNADIGTNKVKFPTLPSPDRSRHSGPSRQVSAASLRSTLSSRSTATSIAGPSLSRSASAATQRTARSVGALERAMETLIEEGASVSVLASGSVLASIAGPSGARGAGKPGRSNTVPGPASPEQKLLKLPTRSYTSPSHPHVHSERVGITGEVARIRNRGSEKRKVRVCARCDSKIGDGRWIRMDGGNVLCERCWKNMYLPKCRRCNLPIEKQAVSSRDGQLKGKYHRDCFSCHTCQKPFPDKEFYVLDGKPFCAYHYHEANDSLCAAPPCGQPIEGPCAVTHLGKRYHPEHLLCEFEDGCRERLVEYWEVDGQMLCERHAGNRSSGWMRSDDPADEAQPKKPLGTDEGRMMKRMTRFIDLGTGEDEEVDIR